MHNGNSLRFLAVLLLLLTFPATGFAQTISQSLFSLNKHRPQPDQNMIPLEKLIKKIESSQHIVFLYKTGWLKDKYVPAGILEQDSLEFKLRAILQQEGLTYSKITARSYAIRPQTAGGNTSEEPMQAEIITGTVTDAESRETLPGVNILVKGTSTGASTDQNGNFELTVSSLQDTLVVSFIGYQRREVPVSGRTEIDIQMIPEAVSGEELVVIGYGTAREKDITGAVSSVDAEDLKDESPSSIQDILRSNIPGLNVGFSTSAKGGGSLRVRGSNSLSAATDPLIVLDGSIYPGQLSDINPNDVETIDVLKDASSAAVYGANAASGVVLITTTKGGAEGTTVRINSNIGIAAMSTDEPVYGPGEFVSWRTDVMRSIHAGGYEPYQFSDPRELPSDISVDEWLSYDGSSGDPVSVWLRRLNMQPIEIENYKAGKTVNWYDMVFQDGVRQNHNISLSGSKDELQYFWSLGYLNNEGIVVGDEFTTIRSRLNLEGEVNDFLTVGINAQFADRDESAISVDWGQITNLSPYGSALNENGEYKWRPNEEASGGNHPFYDRSHRDRLSRERNLHAILFGEIELPFGFSFRSNFTPRYFFIENYNHQSATHEEWGADGGLASRSQATGYHWQVDNILTWEQNFNDIHNFNVTLLANAEKYQRWDNNMNNEGFDPNDNLGYHNIGGGINPTIGSNDQYSTSDALMGRILYTFNDRYTLNTSIRRDGYSAFGENNRRAVFPSAAVGWLFSEEEFVDADWLDYGKIRFSWGSSGNKNIGRYSALSDLTTGKYFYQRPDGELYMVNQLYVNRMSNPNLQWERTTSLNLGIDYSLFNRIDGALEIYEMTTTDLLVERSLPDILGFNWVYDNLGEIKNRGLEFTINSINIQSKDLTWRSNINLQLNRNEIISLYGDLDENGNELDDIENEWFIGRSVHAVWDYSTNGIWQTDEAEQAAEYGQKPGDYKVVDVNNDGQFTNADKRFLGHSEPRFRWSLQNEVHFKNFAFSFTVYSYWGHMNSFNQLQNRGGFMDRGNSYKLPYWTEENPGNQWARLYSNLGGAGNLNTYVDKSFIRLDNISLAYTVPRHVLETFNIQNLRLYTNIRNAAFFAPDWEFWDPENSGPTPRYFNVGIDLTL